jgi:hypothetical protein
MDNVAKQLKNLNEHLKMLIEILSELLQKL